MLSFSFTHVVHESEIKRRAERFEAQAGLLPWNDWTDFRDEAEGELLDELRDSARRLNLREHEFEKLPLTLTGNTQIRCSFVSEVDMVVLRLAI